MINENKLIQESTDKAKEEEKGCPYPEVVAVQKILALGALHPLDLGKLEDLANELERKGPNMGLNIVREWKEAGIELEDVYDERGIRKHRGNPI